MISMLSMTKMTEIPEIAYLSDEFSTLHETEFLSFEVAVKTLITEYLPNRFLLTNSTSSLSSAVTDTQSLLNDIFSENEHRWFVDLLLIILPVDNLLQNSPTRRQFHHLKQTSDHVEEHGDCFKAKQSTAKEGGAIKVNGSVGVELETGEPTVTTETVKTATWGAAMEQRRKASKQVEGRHGSVSTATQARGRISNLSSQKLYETKCIRLLKTSLEQLCHVLKYPIWNSFNIGEDLSFKKLIKTQHSFLQQVYQNIQSRMATFTEISSSSPPTQERKKRNNAVERDFKGSYSILLQALSNSMKQVVYVIAGYLVSKFRFIEFSEPAELTQVQQVIQRLQEITATQAQMKTYARLKQALNQLLSEKAFKSWNSTSSQTKTSRSTENQFLIIMKEEIDRCFQNRVKPLPSSFKDTVIKLSALFHGCQMYAMGRRRFDASLARKTPSDVNRNGGQSQWSRKRKVEDTAGPERYPEPGPASASSVYPTRLMEKVNEFLELREDLCNRRSIPPFKAAAASDFPGLKTLTATFDATIPQVRNPEQLSMEEYAIETSSMLTDDDSDEDIPMKERRIVA